MLARRAVALLAGLSLPTFSLLQPMLLEHRSSGIEFALFGRPPPFCA